MLYIIVYIKYLLQNWRNTLLVNAVPGSVLICFGIPLFAMYRCKNSNTLLVVGAREHFESCQQVLLSIDTIRYF